MHSTTIHQTPYLKPGRGKVAKFLVANRLDGRRVDGPRAVLHRQRQCILCHHRLARRRVCRHKHRVPLLHVHDRLFLKRVELKRKAPRHRRAQQLVRGLDRSVPGWASPLEGALAGACVGVHGRTTGPVGGDESVCNAQHVLQGWRSACGSSTWAEALSNVRTTHSYLVNGTRHDVYTANTMQTFGHGVRRQCGKLCRLPCGILPGILPGHGAIVPTLLARILLDVLRNQDAGKEVLERNLARRGVDGGRDGRGLRRARHSTARRLHRWWCMVVGMVALCCLAGWWGCQGGEAVGKARGDGQLLGGVWGGCQRVEFLCSSVYQAHATYPTHGTCNQVAAAACLAAAASVRRCSASVSVMGAITGSCTTALRTASLPVSAAVRGARSISSIVCAVVC